jgi:putative transposase
VFSNDPERERQDHEVRDLHAKIGQFMMERDFLAAGSSDEPGRAQGDDRARPPRLELEPSMPAASMDGRGRCMDNIFIERLWRSLKYEAVYLHEMTDGFAAERVIGTWIDFYNTEWPHSALDGAPPTEAYSTGRPVDMMDKARALPTYPQGQTTTKSIESD